MQPLHVLDITTRTEGAPSAGEDDDVALLVLNQVIEQPGQFGMRIPGEAVQFLGLVEGNVENAATAFESHRLVVSEIHRRSPGHAGCWFFHKADIWSVLCRMYSTAHGLASNSKIRCVCQVWRRTR
ncbi:hypothetical protein D3C78_1565860 [compost metagenome]